MAIPPSWLSHMIDRKNKQFTGSEVHPAPPNKFIGVLCFKTSNFDAMKKFLAAMGFTVTEGSNQLLPLFSKGRGARVQRNDFDFNLEEDKSGQRYADFDLMVADMTDEEIENAKNSGYGFTYEQTLCGDHYFFTSPDGGKFLIC